MPDRIEKQDLIRAVSARLAGQDATVDTTVEAFLEEIYQAVKRGESVSLREFGAFSVRPEQNSWVFRFNPSQRWRKLFGWSSPHRGAP